MNVVEYRPVVGFPGYRVGTDGSVWSCWKKFGRFRAYIGSDWKRLKPSTTTRYLQVSMSRDGKVYYRKVHHLVLDAFVGPYPTIGMEGCHNDGNPFNCELSNIRWDTRSNNYKDRHKHGTHNDGERNGRSKLSNIDVLEIKELLRLGMSQTKIARIYGVSQVAISFIKRGLHWDHI